MRRTWRQAACSRFYATMAPSGHNRRSRNDSAHLNLPPAPAPGCPNLLRDGVASAAVTPADSAVRIAITAVRRISVSSPSPWCRCGKAQTDAETDGADAPTPAGTTPSATPATPTAAPATPAAAPGGGFSRGHQTDGKNCGQRNDCLSEHDQHSRTID